MNKLQQIVMKGYDACIRVLERNWGLLLVSFIWFFLVINELYWLSADNTPLSWDFAERYIQSIKIFKALSHPSVNILNQIASAHNYYPPLEALVASPFYAIFWISPDVGIAGPNAIFLAILLFSVFGIGNAIKNQETGVLAAFIVSTYPVIFGNSRVFSIDLPLTALVTLFFCALLLTRFFISRNYSIALGVVAGLGMLTKWTFPLFVVGPLIYHLWLSFRKGKIRKSYLNILLFIILAVLVASLWWVIKFHYLVFDFLPLTAAQGIPEGDPQILTDPVFTSLYYLIGLNINLTFFYFIIFLFALPLFLISNLERYTKTSLLLWITIPYLVLTFTVNKEPRFIMPVYSAIAIISATVLTNTLSKVKDKKLRGAFLLLLLSFATFQLFSISYGIPWLPEGKYVPRVPSWGKLYFFSQKYGCAMHPSKLDYKTEEILKVIGQYGSSLKNVNIFIFSEEPTIKYPLQYYSFARNLNYSTRSVGFHGFSPLDYSEADFILIHDPPNVLSYRADSHEIRERTNNATTLFEALNAVHQNFTLVGAIQLPASNLYIYARAQS